MMTRVTSALKRMGLVALVMLISGCAAAAPSGSAMLSDAQAFGTDFVRQVMAALLL
jgi:hypothetical protein